MHLWIPARWKHIIIIRHRQWSNSLLHWDRFRIDFVKSDSFDKRQTRMMRYPTVIYLASFNPPPLVSSYTNVTIKYIYSNNARKCACLQSFNFRLTPWSETSEYTGRSSVCPHPDCIPSWYKTTRTTINVRSVTKCSIHNITFRAS